MENSRLAIKEKCCGSYIHVDDLLISGSGEFIEYISMRMKEKFEADSYGGGKATYLGMEIEKVSDSDSEGIIIGPDNYEGEINHIEIPHERTRPRNDAIAEEEQTIPRSELGGLLRIARISRPGAIYDASAAAQIFPAWK